MDTVIVDAQTAAVVGLFVALILQGLKKWFPALDCSSDAAKRWTAVALAGIGVFVASGGNVTWATAWQVVVAVGLAMLAHGVALSRPEPPQECEAVTKGKEA
jgi:hypothetical protein